MTQSVFRTFVTARICGTKNAWSVGETAGVPISEVPVELEIQGQKQWGYHLVISPFGFFTADYHYDSLKEAFSSASEVFGVELATWKEVLPE